jgi:PAS domain S-box-containing protein
MLKPQQIGRSTAFGGLESRQHFLRILFVHRSLADIERCLHELKRVGFTVTSDVVVTPEQFADRLHSQCFDLVLAEYPSSNWQETQALSCLRQTQREIPLIYLVHFVKRETVAELILQGASDCIEMDGISHLPVAIHRAQDEMALRDARNQAEKQLRQSEARYRALTGNPNYGICRCGLDGTLLEVNEAMIKMLGYASREELLKMNLASDVARNSAKGKQLLEQLSKAGQADPIDMEWNRKDHAPLKVHLSGQEVLSEQGELSAYELIAEDVTKQRELEDHLRRQAASDPLTWMCSPWRSSAVNEQEESLPYFYSTWTV